MTGQSRFFKTRIDENGSGKLKRSFDAMCFSDKVKRGAEAGDDSRRILKRLKKAFQAAAEPFKDVTFLPADEQTGHKATGSSP